MAKRTKSESTSSTKTDKAPTPIPTRDCACGCGNETKSIFAPGHDARLKGQLQRLERGMNPVAAGISPTVLKKLENRVGFVDVPETGGRKLDMDWKLPREVAALLAD